MLNSLVPIYTLGGDLWGTVLYWLHRYMWPIDVLKRNHNKLCQLLLGLALSSGSSVDRESPEGGVLYNMGYIGIRFFSWFPHK